MPDSEKPELTPSSETPVSEVQTPLSAEADTSEKTEPRPVKRARAKRISPIGAINRFCEHHNFSRFAVVLSAIILIFLIVGFVIGGFATSTHLITKTTQLGLRNIGELATQSGYYTNVQSISNARTVFGWQVPFTSNKYIFSYDGVIKAGIDFSEVSYSVDALTNTITVTLPEVEVFSNEIDESSLQIFDESKNIFTPLSITTLTDARIEMKEDAKQRAIDNGLLENARQNAELLIRGFLAGSYDLQVYTIEFE